MVGLRQFSIKLDPHNLVKDVVQPAVRMLEIEAKSKNIKICVHDATRTTSQVLIDKCRTQQILINLIRNSIKFSKRDSSVDITLSDTKVA